jgi:hypothetical protein
MRRILIGGLLGLVCLVLQASLMPARALVALPSSIPDRVAGASAIVIGKVTTIEEKTVQARPNPAAQPVEYQIAVIKIDEAILGAKGLTHIRVGFIPAPPPLPPGGPVRPPIGRSPQVNLTKDQEVCLFLQPHGTESFMTAPMYTDVIDKKNAKFTKDLEQIRRCVKLLADPMASLKSKDAKDQFTTAAMLIARYRTVKGPIKGTPRQEPIDAEESKLILRALAEADWAARPTTPGEPTPQVLFNRLGVTEKDGWVRPKNIKEMPTAAKKWLTENVDKYRIQRYVLENTEK